MTRIAIVPHGKNKNKKYEIVKFHGIKEVTVTVTWPTCASTALNGSSSK
jgi:hypothetical protein